MCTLNGADHGPLITSSSTPEASFALGIRVNNTDATRDTHMEGSDPHREGSGVSNGCFEHLGKCSFKQYLQVYLPVFIERSCSN